DAASGFIRGAPATVRTTEKIPLAARLSRRRFQFRRLGRRASAGSCIPVTCGEQALRFSCDTQCLHSRRPIMTAIESTLSAAARNFVEQAKVEAELAFNVFRETGIITANGT